MKVHPSITVDAEVWQLAKQEFKNISELMNDLLKSALMISNPENKEFLDLLKIKQQLQNDILELRKVKDKEVQIKKSDSEIIVIDRKKCLECGDILSNKRNHKFPAGEVCHSCFMTSINHKKWMRN